MLWIAFMNAVVIYNVIIFIMSRSDSDSDRIVRELSVTDPVVAICGTLGIIALVGSIILARTPITQSAQDYPKFIIRMAVAEAPAILGLVISFTTLRPEPLWITSAVSILLFILHRPTSQTV